MQKKKIKEIPVPAHDGRHRFCARCQIVTISKTEHLIVDIFRLTQHMYRIAINPTEFDNYAVETDYWSDIEIESWRSPFTLSSKLMCDTKDIDIARKYVAKNKLGTATGGPIRNIIKEAESRITVIKKLANETKKNREQAELFGLIPEDKTRLAEEQVKTYIAPTNVILYKRHGKYSSYFCCQCGKSYHRCNDPCEPVYHPVPVNGGMERCGKCGCAGTARAQGRYKGQYGGVVYTLVYDALPNGMLLVRGYLTVYSRQNNEPITLSTDEKYRMFAEPGRVREYRKEYYSRKWTAGDYNVNRCAVIDTGSECINNTNLRYYPEGIETLFLHPTVRSDKATTRYDCIKAYANCPQLEPLYKNGFKYMCRWLVYKKGKTNAIDKKAVRASDILRLTKQEYNWVTAQLHSRRKEEYVLETARLLHDNNYSLREAETIYAIINEYSHRAEIIKKFLEYQSPTQLYNYIHKLIDSGAFTTIYEVYREYYDYIKMRESLGHDLTNTVHLHPRSLHIAYGRLRSEEAIKNAAGYIEEMKKKYPNIAKYSAKIPKKYTWQQAGLTIRPAADVEEIVIEGRTLHHCVGSDSQSYMKNFNVNKTWILLVRRKEYPDIPYVTVEFRNGKIVQWYGCNDSKPDKEEVQAFLDKFLGHISRKREKEKISA